MNKWMAAATAQCAVVKKYRDKGDRKLGCAAQDRDDDRQPASGVRGVQFSCEKKEKNKSVGRYK